MCDFKFQIVSIEGNIGSGKSTLMAELKKYYENDVFTVFLKEPVDEWEKIKDEHGKTILEKFYAEQDKYSFSFQMMAYVSRLKVLMDTLKDINRKLNINENGIKDEYIQKNKTFTIITERSLYTDKMVFAKMLYDSEKIEFINYQIYLSWFNTFSEFFPVHKIVYVKAEPKICHERIHIRSREGEEKIPLDYLINCDKYHDDMLDINNNICNIQLRLDGNINIYKNKNQMEEWIENINNFITK